MEETVVERGSVAAMRWITELRKGMCRHVGIPTSCSANNVVLLTPRIAHYHGLELELDARIIQVCGRLPEWDSAATYGRHRVCERVTVLL
jgi:hypothetical protein